MRFGKLHALGVLFLLSGCAAKNDGSSPATPTPSGAPTPGPTPQAPHLDSIGPIIGGAAKNTWLLNGSSFSADPASNVVLFGGHAATVASASATQLTVTDAIAPVAAAGSVEVTVQVAGRTSNALTVATYPDGAKIALPWSTFHHADQLAVSPTTIYVLDRAQGLFGVTRGSHSIEPVALSGVGGMSVVTGAAVSPSGVLYVTDQSGSTSRVFRANAQGALTLFATLPQPVTALAIDSDDKVYLLLTDAGTTTMAKLLANGAPDTAFGSPTVGTPATAVVFQNSLLDVLDAGGQQVVQVDPNDGTVNPFAMLTAATGPMVGDGMNLFFLDAGVTGGEISFVDCCGNVNQFTQTPITNQDASVHDYATFTGLAIDSMNRLYLSGGPDLPGVLDPASMIADARVIRLDDAGTVNLEVTGLNLPLAIVYDGALNLSRTIVSDAAGCLVNSAGVDQGAIFSYVPGAPLQQISSGACPIGGIAADGASVILADTITGSLERVSLLTAALFTVAGPADGFNGISAVVRDGAGNLYAIGRDSSGTMGGVHRVAANGTITLDFVTSPDVVAFQSGTIVGGELFLGAMLTQGNAFAQAPVATGGAATLLPAPPSNIAAIFGGMTPDGAGGFYAADSATGMIWDVTNAGATVNPVTAGAALNGNIDLDPFGNLVFTDAASTSAFAALLP